MKFQVVGADRKTGEDVEIIVDARDEVDAETIANRRNIIVSTVVLVRSLPPEPQQSSPIRAKKSVKQCPQCKEWINKGATKCPHCRSTQPVPPWTYAIAALFVIGPALWCSGLLFAGIEKFASEVEKAEIEEKHFRYKSEVREEAQWYVREQLDSARYIDFSEWLASTADSVVYRGNGRYWVTGWVIYQDQSGKSVRTSFKCRMTHLGYGQWRYDAMDFR